MVLQGVPCVLNFLPCAPRPAAFCGSIGNVDETYPVLIFPERGRRIVELAAVVRGREYLHTLIAPARGIVTVGWQRLT